MLDDGTADIFRWDQVYDFIVKEAINPNSYVEVYRKERKLIHSTEMQKGLYNKILTFEPEVIVCHSLGCELLLKTLRSSSTLPPFIKKIAFSQADISHNASIPRLVKKRIQEGELSLINYYCPWDILLMASTFMNKRPRSGLKGHKDTRHVKNTFFPLYKTINLHQSGIADELFLKNIFK